MGTRVSIVLFLVLAAGCGGSPSAEDEQILETSAELGAAPCLKRGALSTGVQLEYLEQGSDRGEPVIFIHGFTDSHHSFDRNLPIFPRRFHVFALDLRGHGDSSKPECCYTQADFAADVVA